MTQPRHALVVRSLIVGATLVIIGCTGETPRAVSERGDTTVVELPSEARPTPKDPDFTFTTADVKLGSFDCLAALPDGRVAVFDLTGPSLVVVTPTQDGPGIEKLGRSGSGPAEYGAQSGYECLAVSAGGVVALIDGGHARIVRWSSTGVPLEQFALPGYPAAIAPRIIATDTSAFVRLAVEAPRKEYRRNFDAQSLAFVEVGPASSTGDTVRPEVRWGADASDLMFAPSQFGIPLSSGRRLYASSQRPAFLVKAGNDVVSLLEVDWPAVHVVPEEAKAIEAIMTYHSPPGSPAPPFPGVAKTKAFFSEIRVSPEGNFWVRRAEPAERGEPIAALPWATNPPSPIVEYYEPVVYDGYSPTGRRLGGIRLPRATSLASFAGGYVWGVYETPSGDQALSRWAVSP